ncbi:TPA: choice-of-anchor D domain-containing protein, partial [Candidatus Poribacteria bacterium]|nr:choice-of-anchor D domain-containing protein [Candidatus Poribacteria bacterium]
YECCDFGFVFPRRSNAGIGREGRPCPLAQSQSHPPPQLAVSPNSLDFGDVNIGQSRSKTLTISNPGKSILILSDIAVSEAAFGISQIISLLNPGQSFDLTVTFIPTAEGVLSATLTIQSNDPHQPRLTVSLKGKGVPASARLMLTVKDSSNGKPIAGATVKVDGRSAKTDPKGKFEISLSPGRYEVIVSAKGYLIPSKTIKVKPGEKAELSFPAIPALEVWPGDTDNNGEVSILDILPIGRFWGERGEKRVPQQSKWQMGLTPKRGWSPPEAAFADADGNGVVDEKDVLVIARNWRKRRAEGTPAPEANDYMKLLAQKMWLDRYRKMYHALEEMGEIEGAIELRHMLKRLITALKPVRSMLLANYPNPFNPDTWIPFVLGEKGEVVIRIYDLQGRVVRELKLGYREAGYYLDKGKAARWDGRNEKGEEVASGVYLIELKVGEFRSVKKALMTK